MYGLTRLYFMVTEELRDSFFGSYFIPMVAAIRKRGTNFAQTGAVRTPLILIWPHYDFLKSAVRATFFQASVS